MLTGETMLAEQGRFASMMTAEKCAGQTVRSAGEQIRYPDQQRERIGIM